MVITFEVFRGSTEGNIVADKTTRTLQANEVYIETTHSGLCGSDEHFLRTGQVLGHEGVGIVRRLGSNVTNVRVGDRVGFGFIQSVCGKCQKCSTGWDQYCERRKEYGSHNQDIGSFGEGVVWDADSVIPIPDGYDSVDAAPLMCAGATVWTVLAEYGVQCTDRVGIMGLGGLGHLAVKLAAAMGCHVVVLSSSNVKRGDALRFGASEYHVFKPGKQIPDFRPVNHLLLCTSVGLSYESVIPLVDTNGSIYPLTVDFTPISVPLLAILAKGIRIQGTMVASRQNLRNLVQFAAEKKIVPTTMEFPLTRDGVNLALQTLGEGRMRYRGVLVRQ